MVASGSRKMIAGSLSGCIAGFLLSLPGSHNHPARDTRALAQGRLSLLLTLEVAPTGRATADPHGAARVDPADELALSSFADDQRIDSDKTVLLADVARGFHN